MNGFAIVVNVYANSGKEEQSTQVIFRVSVPH